MVLTEDSIDLPTPTGPMRTYVYRPAQERRFPGIVLYSEIFQRTGPIKRTAAMLAGNGFVVAVPEVFHDLEPAGTELAYDQAGADKGNHHKVARSVAEFDADARAVISLLGTHPNCTGKLGAFGVCLGGHLAFRAAMNPEIRATACFYATDIHKGTLGRGGDDSLARCADLQGEMLMIWGRQDPHVPDEGRALIQRTMRDAGVDFTWHEFNAAHAFMRDEGPRYDPALALTCYRLSIDLFVRTLWPDSLA